MQHSRPLQLSRGTNQGCLLSCHVALRAVGCGLRHSLSTSFLGGVFSGPRAETRTSERICSCVSPGSYPWILQEEVLHGISWERSGCQMIVSKAWGTLQRCPRRHCRALEQAEFYPPPHHPYLNQSSFPLLPILYIKIPHKVRQKVEWGGGK